MKKSLLVSSLTHLLMDRAYESGQTRQLALRFGYIPVAHPKLIGWDLGNMIVHIQKRNEIERLFHRFKEFCRIFSRFDKLNTIFLSFIHFAHIVEALGNINEI
ncbi:hypothetical protein SAMN05216419_101741 [Nitrosomonas cryotolerans]|uniref:Transposase DDE domain-containing protein n=1 Tax=Nitrosomonas cryotolerans ATCC 49181 TaxID=1131553 RepID=A0A1N6FC21_9PROT|nr:hypothetical protein SAMN05216419_101741 [Nitrosomonas cryotolerans]SIN92841.1 hypothetical protein SAMN02743940_0190 [Nitrosomonas cryotolerans ATCC 49181]